MDKKIMTVIWAQYSGRILCTFLAFLIGIVYLICGFWKTVVFWLLILLGYYVGRYVDRKEGLKDMIDKVFVKRWVDK